MLTVLGVRIAWYNINRKCAHSIPAGGEGDDDGLAYSKLEENQLPDGPELIGDGNSSTAVKESGQYDGEVWAAGSAVVAGSTPGGFVPVIPFTVHYRTLHITPVWCSTPSPVHLVPSNRVLNACLPIGR